ncbi:uncharacterized protein ARMOST_15484 [Armillaria ostoyae]|uniref:Uncharacterized protein n=1 Tax=Armillaria ostoyae TaxID=47428 RepID=A0A284RTH0_ARMOS|nr:uncharacterized protein ARMOST_15484 [Armillaria ostoyae]
MSKFIAVSGGVPDVRRSRAARCGIGIGIGVSKKRRLPEIRFSKGRTAPNSYVGHLVERLDIRVTEVARYVTRSFILWDYLISIDNEVDLVGIVLKKIVDQISVLCESLPGLLLRFWDVIRERYKLKYSTCGAVLSPTARSSKEIRCLLVYPESIIYVTMQFVVIGIILVLRV